MRPYRPIPAVVFAITLCALVGGLFGGRALATDERIQEHYETFSAALAAIEASYVSDVDSDRLIYGAVRGMLATLDPHSSFFDPREYAQMRERQEGRYYGIGVSIQAVAGYITAANVFEHSPAYRVGVRRGDQFAVIAGEEAQGWSTEQAMLALRGAKGTAVQIEVRRRGYEELIPFELIRDEVLIRTVQSHFMIDDETGYVHLKDFGENSSSEVESALLELRTQGMKRLLFDLRGNPGGPLDQAISVSNHFLPSSQMIVYTRGRVSNSDQDYRSREQGDFTGMPMVVLTNRTSASASEIVAGALQDHDRAFIVGETTFGKALVQSVYRISGGAGLALTTAHYYTPSGRLIQRPWDASFDEYLSYSLQDQDANRPHDPDDLKRTQGGRPVYSGGGIEPDRHIAGPIEGFDPTPFGRLLYSRGTFENYAVKFMAEGDTRVSQESVGRTSVARDFAVDDAMVADFEEQLRSDGFRINEEEFAQNREFIRAMIGFRIDQVLFNMAEARRRLIAVDPQAQVALGLFGEAEELVALNSRVNQAN